MADLPFDADCIFCKIVDGQIPCRKIYEDDHVLSFLDLGPISEGHTLVIPKGHWPTLDAMDHPATLAAIGPALAKVGTAVSRAFECPGYNVLQNNGSIAGQAVFHVHFHIIPKYDDQRGLIKQWDAGDLDASEAKSLVQRIVAQLP